MRRLLIFGCLVAFSRLSDAALKWTSSYHLKAILTVPSANLVEPYEVWFDGDSGRSRVDYYGGVTKLYREYNAVAEKYRYYKIQPQTSELYLNKEVCHEISSESTDSKMYAAHSYLPTKNFQYVKNEILNDEETKKYVFQFEFKIEPDVIGRVIYAMWVKNRYSSSEGGEIEVPIRFDYNLKEGDKVIDHYRHDYIYFDELKPDVSVLRIPPGIGCQNFEDNTLHNPLDPIQEYLDHTVEHLRVQKAFDGFKSVHGKKYTDERDVRQRMQYFKSNLRYINSINRQKRNFRLSVNHLADLSDEEMEVFRGTRFSTEQLMEYNLRSRNDTDEYDDDEYLDGDKSNAFLDWRDAGAVSPVKDQTAMCGACYAFTTAAALEAEAYVAAGCKGGTVKEISEQAFVDCTWGSDPDHGNIGCEGGTYEYTLKWIKKYGAVFKEEYGPYLALEGRCHLLNMTTLLNIKDFRQVPKKKREIKGALQNHGPLLASIDSNVKTFTFYKGGIYDDEECHTEPDRRSHGMTIVGYGRENDQEYWIMKNSYGAQWGEHGYIRMAIKNNVCGAKNFVYYANFNLNLSKMCYST